MNWLTRTFSSSVGSKTLLAVSGILLVGFLVAHLAGNLLIFAGPAAINGYARGLRDYPAILWLLRSGLLLTAIIHIYTSLRLTRANRAARPEQYHLKRSVKATLPARTMALSGLLVLAFIVYHLAHLTFRLTHREAFAGLGDYDAYSMMVLSFQSPLVSLFYVIALTILMLHLNHGVASLFQTLGLNHSKYNGVLRTFGRSLSIALTLGFISIPLAVLLGFVR